MHSSRNAALGLATLAALGLAAAHPQAAQAQTAYGVTFLDEQLISINEATGVGTLVGPLSPGVTPFGLAYSGGHLLTFDGSKDAVDQIDPATGATLASTPVTIPGGNGVLGQGGFAVDSNGNGYLTSALDPTTFAQANDLYRVNLTTGAATLVANTNPTLEALAFSPGGTLYGLGKANGTDDGNLFTVDPTTGTTTLIGNTGVSVGSPTGGLTFDGNTLLGTIDDALYTIDPATGAATPVATDPTDGTPILTGYSSISGLAVAPEPSEWVGLALGALSLAGLGWKARRKH